MQDDPVAVKGLLDFLRSHDIAVLATVREDSAPHAASIYYFVDDDFKLYFLTKDLTTKYKNLRKSERVSLVVTDPKLLETVQIEGAAKEVDYAHEYASVVEKFTENLIKNGMSWEQVPFNHYVSGYYVFIQVTPSWIRWSDFKDWAHTMRFEKRFF